MLYRIINGTVIDGTGGKAFEADVEINDGRITAVAAPGSFLSRGGPTEESRPKGRGSARYIDASGCYVSPGFIDAHSHADLGPYVPNKLKLKLRQGISTEVVGQCGFSPAPMPAERQAEWLKYYVPGSPLDSWPWQSTAEFYEALRSRGLPLNFMPFVGHGTLRFAVKGDSSAPMGPKELDLMENLLEQAFAEGAAGLSFGLIYVPALCADKEELRRAARCAARNRRILSVHLRSESNELLEALKEMIKLQSETGVRIHISHLKAIGRGRAGSNQSDNQAKIEQALELIEKNQLSFDSYPYTYGSTSLLSMLPPHLFAGKTVRSALSDLSNPQLRQETAALLRGDRREPPGLPWDNLAQLLGWDQIELVHIPPGKDTDLIGKNLAAAAEDRRRSPEELTIQLAMQYGGQVRIIDEFSCEATLKKIIGHPSGILSSDSLLGGRLHPRVSGSFPRVLSKYTLEKGGGPLTLEEAVHRMTGRSAQFFGLKNRGTIEVGTTADIAVWSSDFKDVSRRSAPEQPARGLEFLCINGRMVLGPDKNEAEGMPKIANMNAGRILTAPHYVFPQRKYK